eukprot:TRINITY_DN62884_c0_g1_i1.p1 TRINITY_DN62884_c0_g1~~TRINITY_DN62884_c0_g1_i1.p1  ORF type:complete len:480 (-),score=61.81 TRINITY_DN62884_c0_g1_i1:257-1696(-)
MSRDDQSESPKSGNVGGQRPHLTHQECYAVMNSVTAIEEVFARFDFDHNHQLDRDEIKAAFNVLMFPCSERDMDVLFNGGDGHPGGLDKRQFALYCFHMETNLRNMFSKLDEDQNGYISPDEFRKSVQAFGWKLSAEQSRTMLDRLDTDHDGRLTYVEWRHLLTLAPPEGKAWVDVFQMTKLASEGIAADNLRPIRSHGESRMVDLLAGLTAGTVSRTVTAPAERIKTELQLASKSESVLEVCRRIMAQGGTRAFFQGNLANCIKVAPQSALFFSLTDFFKRKLPTRVDSEKASLHSFLSGTLAGIASQFLIYPLEPIKTKLTVAPQGQYSGLVDCGRELFREGGVRAFYRGALPTLAGCIPYSGIQRLTYDWMQQEYVRRSEAMSPSPLVGLCCGLISSAIGMTASYPLVLVRTRMQMQKAGHYDGVYDCALRTVRAEGVRGLFKGIVPNLAKAAPAAAINFALYDYAKEVIHASGKV